MPTTPDRPVPDRPAPALTPSAATVLTVPQGRIALPRTPQRGRGPLRAWDAADEHVLHHLAEAEVPIDGRRAVVVGDRAGALAIALHRGGAAVTSVSDSWLAHQALAANLAAGDLPADAVATAPSTATADDLAADGPVDLLVVKVPRAVAVLDDQLRRVRPALAPDAVVIGAGMTRHVHTSTSAAFAAVIGPTRTSLARKKARLLHSDLDADLDPGPPPPPSSYALPSGQVVLAHPAVFSAGRLDPGTAVLLAHLPVVDAGAHAVDLGCGDGVVGLVLATAQPSARVTFVDESHAAIASARATMAANLPGRDVPGGDAYVLGDGMDALPDASVDVVVVNPPFHDDHAEGDAIAWAMLTGADRALRPGGRVVVVGNRHLGHHAKLTRIFGGHRVLGADRRFVVLEAEQRRGMAR